MSTSRKDEIIRLQNEVIQSLARRNLSGVYNDFFPSGRVDIPSLEKEAGQPLLPSDEILAAGDGTAASTGNGKTTSDAKAEEVPKEKLEDLLAELNGYIGLDTVKEEIDTLVHWIQMQQLRKEHLRAFRKSIRQIWLRATGDGRFAMLVQANLRGRNSAHESKTFTDFVQRSIPEILSLHFIQCKPDHLFDPATAQTVSTEAKCVFGKDFMPIADTGFSMHVLDWAPRVKDAWIGLPKRIADAIHPTKGDRLFEFYSASSYVGASLASMFDSVDCLDCRETAMLSSKYNA